VRMYSRYTAASMIDWYPISRAGIPCEYPVISPAAMCQAAWESGARRVWFIPQAFADPRKRRLPTAAQVRLMTWLPLACGSTGILYFVHQSGPVWYPWGGAWAIADIVLSRPSEMGQEVMRLGQIVPIVGPVLLGTRWTPDSDIRVQCEELPAYGIPTVRADLSRGEDYDVIVVCNQDVEQPRRGTISLPEGMLAGRRLFDLTDRARVLPQGGSFEVELPPGGGLIFAAAAPGVDQRIFDGMDRRLYGKRLALYEDQLREAEAVGVDLTAARAAAVQAAELLGSGRCAEAAETIEDAQDAVAAALAGDGRYSECLRRVEELRTRISEASARFEQYAGAIPEADRQGKLQGELAAQVAGMTACCRDWYLGRYALMTGDVEGCARDLPAAEQRATDTIAALDAAIAPQ